MNLEFQMGDQVHFVDTSDPIDISIPIHFSAGQVSAFGAPKATARPLEAGRFIGDTRKGGSCNCETITTTPHCNGTHTEGVGHILSERISIHSITRPIFCPATLITLSPEHRCLSRDAIRSAVSKFDSNYHQAVIVRTLPNDDSKLTRTYSDSDAAFFSPEATRWLAANRIQHLVCDLPSVDPISDGGRLSAHRAFWDLPEGATHTQTPSSRTITELAYIPPHVADGHYLLSLTPLAYDLDAVPSRPVLFRLKGKGL